MFFKNIETWTNKKLTTLSILFDILYFCLSLLAPIIVVVNKYKIFTVTDTTEATKIKLTGIGMIFALCIIIITFSKLKAWINKMPEVKVYQQRLKFSMCLIYDLIIPIVVVWVLSLMRDNFLLAYSTIRYIVIFMACGGVVDNLFIKFLSAEKKIRNDAAYDKEKEKRKSVA